MTPDFIRRQFTKPVKLISTLDGHNGPIASLAFSPDTKYLAGGTTDGIKIWDLETKQLAKVPRQALQERAQVSALCWFSRSKEGHYILCYGNATGFLVFLECRQGQDCFEIVSSSRVANGGEIICLAATSLRHGVTRVTLGTRDRCIQVWNFDAGSQSLTSLHSKSFPKETGVVPKALAFEKNRERDLYVFGLFDGGLYRYDGKTAKNISRYQLESQIGNAAVDVERRICVIDNVMNGFDAYQIDSGNFIQGYRTGNAMRTYPKGVALGSQSKLVVGGSDHGKVYVFDRKTGSLLKTLNHRQDGGVETIAANDASDERVYVASASSTVLTSESNPVHVWRLQMNVASKTTQRWTFIRVVDFVARVVAVLMAGSYLFNYLLISAYTDQTRTRTRAAKEWIGQSQDVDKVANNIYVKFDHDVYEAHPNLRYTSSNGDERREGEGAT